MQITTFAVDLAKTKFQVHGFTAHGEKVLAKTLTRGRLLGFFEGQEGRGRVVMEACGTAHHWARELIKRGYQVELLPAQHVARLVVGNKTDSNDADAIYEAAQRPRIRRVAIKSEAQQEVLAVHRVRERLVKARTTLINQIRGLLSERGVVFGTGVAALRRGLAPWLAEAQGPLAELIGELREEWQALDARIARQEARLRATYRSSPGCQLIGAVEGIGELTATAMVASVGDGRAFSSGRQMAAWLGLTPREHSSGARRRLLGITKRGDTYLRTLLIHGARSAVLAARRKTDARSRWIQALVARRGHNVAVVAVANKNARILWALLRTGECYRRPQAAVA